MEIKQGFHRMFLKPKKSVKPKNLKNTNELFGFHLKYINKNIIERKHNNVKDRLYHANYAYVSNIEDIYDSLYTTAFPLHNFFEKIQLRHGHLLKP